MTETEKPNWLKIKPAEFEKLVLEVAKEEKDPAKVGLILRDKHAIPKAKLLGRKIGKILEKSKIAQETNKEITDKKIKNIERHLEKNSADKKAKLSLIKKRWIMHKFAKA